MEMKWVASPLFIAWMILSVYWMGKILACLESIAKSLRRREGE